MRLTLICSLTLLLGCASDGAPSDAEEPHWGYVGDEGPDHWAQLSPDYRLADAGHKQSPLDIVRADAVPGALPPLELHYHATDAHWLNNGHTLVHEEHSDNHLVWGGERYELKQYHIHTPSEHTLDGLHAPGELHMVHADAAGNLLVLGLLMVAGDEHPELADGMEMLPEGSGEEADLPVARDPMEFLPDNLGYWHYQGSLTTPPCTEGVIWILLREPVRMPNPTLRRLAEILGRNNRPVMPSYGRVVTVVDG